jgi:HD-GYP domain-containing protein (c-di-GMP phosphodiesterase class II)
MPRKSLADRIRESGGGTQRRLDESVQVLTRISERPSENGQEDGDGLSWTPRANHWDLARRDAETRGEAHRTDRRAEGEAEADAERVQADPGEALYGDLYSYYWEVLGRASRDEAFSVSQGEELIARAVDAMAARESLYVKALYSGETMDFLAYHSINVAVYLIKMASGLGLGKARQVEMGLAGLFHDIGRSKIPPSVLYKKEPLTEAEQRLFKKSPVLGYEMLKPNAGEYPWLPECALQAYERIDGSGYPNGIRGDEINDYAQLIGLVDVYEALTHSRPQRDKYPHFTAVKEIIQSWKKAFKRQYLKALLINFSVFPLNSYVQLNSNAIGRVVETYPDQPLRPRVQIMFDSQRKRVRTERIVDLPKMPLLYIVDSVPEGELERLFSAS